MSNDHDEGAQVEASGLRIKSSMECCDNMASISPQPKFFTILKVNLKPLVRHFLILTVPVITESLGQTTLIYQKSWVTTSDPPVKIFKEVNSYII